METLAEVEELDNPFSESYSFLQEYKSECFGFGLVCKGGGSGSQAPTLRL